MLAKKYGSSDLAINGGTPVRTKAWPKRRLFGVEEKNAVDALFDDAIASGNPFVYEGPTEKAYCKEFADFMGGGFVDAVNSGTAAIYVALRALDLEPFTEVIVSPITDPGGMMPIALQNCIPVVVDTAPGSFCVGPEQIEAAITPLTSAVVVAHIMGEPADMDGIMAVARQHNLPVIEDCAQAHAAKLHSQYVGTFGNAGAFSTMYGKHHATGAQGGLVFTKSQEMYANIRRASDRGKPYGLPAGSSNVWAALNFNLGDLGAAIGRVQLQKLPVIVERRRAVVSIIASGLSGFDVVSLPKYVPGAEPSFWELRLRLNKHAITCSKQEFCTALEAEGIKNTLDYTALPHLYDWYRQHRVFGSSQLPWSSPLYKGNAGRDSSCPNAMEAISDHFLVSVNENWGEEEAADVVEAIRKVSSVFAV